MIGSSYTLILLKLIHTTGNSICFTLINVCDDWCHLKRYYECLVVRIRKVLEILYKTFVSFFNDLMPIFTKEAIVLQAWGLNSTQRFCTSNKYTYKKPRELIQWKNLSLGRREKNLHVVKALCTLKSAFNMPQRRIKSKLRYLLFNFVIS